VMRATLADMGAPDNTSVAALAFIMAAMALLASWVPARRAARSDPAIAMRAE